MENLCSNLWRCITTHIEYGLRLHGGIGDILNMVSFHDLSNYLIKFFYSFIFFIIIIILLLELLFGIIIDTFAELREEQAKIDFDKKDVCFICGAKRDEIEKDGIDFDKHTEDDHNFINYIYYIIGLKFEDIQNLNKINSFSFEQIAQKSISWIPDYKKKLDKEVDLSLSSISDVEKKKVD